MFGWLKKSQPKSRTIGEPPFDWQPTRLVVPTYSLEAKDRSEYEQFIQRTRDRAEFKRVVEYSPVGPEPKRDQLDPDISYWARVGNELWFLAERTWFYFPDPLQYALLVWDRRRKRLLQFGNFAILPETWKLPSAVDQ